MKILIKDLPSKKDIKAFYNLNPSKDFNVNKVHIHKNEITLECTLKKGKSYFITNFYMVIDGVNFETRKFNLSINKKHFNHLVKNINFNLEYLKNL